MKKWLHNNLPPLALLVLGLIAIGFIALTSMGANVVDPGGFSRIDTFGSDVTIGTSRTVVKSMYITAYTSAKTVTFIDANSGGKVLVLEVPSGSTIKVEDITFPEGLVFDDSASDLAASDFIFIWTR